MAIEPPPGSQLGRSAHIIVWVVVLLIAGAGLAWLYLTPPRPSPQTMQASDQAAPQRAAEEKATAERAAAEKAAADKAADEQAFAAATGTGTVPAFESYIRNNPSGAHIAEARARIAALSEEESRRAAEARAAQERAAAERTAAEKAATEKAAAERAAAADKAAADEKAAAERAATEQKANDDRAFATATQTNTVAALETYIRTNTAGAHIAEARQRIADLTEQARRAAEAKAADEQAWIEAAQAGNAAALEAYIRDHPSGGRVEEARQRIAVINEQARREAEERAERAATEKLAAERAADDRAFAEAAKAGTIQAFEGYIRGNASGAHVMAASQHLAHLRAAAEKKSAQATSARRSTTRDRLRDYVPQKPVYKAPPLSAAMR